MAAAHEAAGTAGGAAAAAAAAVAAAVQARASAVATGPAEVALCADVTPPAAVSEAEGHADD